MVLAVIMLLASMSLLISCSKEEEKKDDAKKDDAEGVVEEDSIFYERSLVSDELPEKDYGGKEFRIVTYFATEFFYPEERINKGDLIVDAKMARNKKVEDRFNVKIVKAYEGSAPEVDSYATKTILAASDEFDLHMGMSIHTGNAVIKNLFLNWYDIEHVDFTKPWWAASNSDELTYDGKCIIAVSDFNFSSITQTYCLAFNKSLAASWDL
jgi:hypothetical protein